MTVGPFLLAGLGNPGREHKADRHNVGFMLLDRLAHDAGVRFERVRFQALVTTGRLASRRVILAKPQTYMNASGRAVGQLARFFKIEPASLLVAYDDLDLPLGTIRLRSGGGSGGHRGVASIVEELGSQDFPRLRLGIGRPPGRMDPADYVLQSFRPDEEPVRDLMLAHASDAVQTFLRDGIELAMSRHNGPVAGEADTG
jgi:PTH1 family peptidyl-tRNA hydrolase